MTDWENAVKDGVVQVAGSRLSQEDVCVKLILTGAGTDCGVADPTGTASGGLAQPTIRLVKVSVREPARIDIGLTRFDLTLSAKVAARYERDVL